MIESTSSNVVDTFIGTIAPFSAIDGAFSLTLEDSSRLLCP